MKKTIAVLLLGFALTCLMTSCGISENYSNGERVGLITQFSKTGSYFKSYEGHLNMTQTGMNSSTPFDFSIDNDDEDPIIIAKLDSAAKFGWKVELTYHQVKGKNFWHNRGHTDYFVTAVDILDRNMTHQTNNISSVSVPSSGGKTDTIYVVIVDKSRLK